MHTSTLAAVATALLMSVSAAAGAQDEKKPPPREFNIDLGYVSVSGNTSTSTLSMDEKLIQRVPKWEFRQEFGAVYGKTDGTETSNLWRALLRADYAFTPSVALYGRATYDRNKFAGVDSRLIEGLGLAWRVLATDINQLNVEGGFELVQQDNIDGTDDDFSALRLASTWKHLFTERAYFYQEVEFLPNLDVSDDMRVNTETAIVAPLSEHVAMKASYKVRFDNLPSLNAAGTAPLRKTDRILSTGIQVTF